MTILNKALFSALVTGLSVTTLVACAGSEQETAQVQASVEQQATKKAPLRKPKQDVVMPNQTPPVDELSKGDINATWFTGTLTYYSFEGGFYGFHGDNGERFLPFGLDKSMQQDGAKVKIYGHVMKDVMTTQQWGEPFKVYKAELLEPGTKPVDKSLY